MEHELRGEGPTAVLVHGLTVDRRVMIEAFDELLAGAGVRRLYVDLPGHGASAGDAARASADAFVDELAALVRATLAPAAGRPGELEAPIVVGYSYGGYLAQALVRELGGARGLMLVCPVVEPDFARRTQPARRVAAHDPDLTYASDPREREAFAEVAVQMTRPVLERFQRAVHPANIAADAAVVTAVRARYALSRPIGDALARLDAPSTIVCGRDDHWAGWQDAVPLVAQLKRPHFVVLPDCGHLLPFEQPLAFAQAVRDFLARAL
ncbi:MAG TPA: alpha/beta hydrolase [Polyangia bacterium]|jgi:pimeloyl-ACP methyl ester carboxylesterase|nr:alpha/beta hydrolase [Polyangia bacterium]